jgi:hypothetical protein
LTDEKQQLINGSAEIDGKREMSDDFGYPEDAPKRRKDRRCDSSPQGTVYVSGEISYIVG